MDCSMSPFNEIHTVILKCPIFGLVSEIASSIVEDELVKVIREYDEIEAEGVPHGWMDDSYESQVRMRLFDVQGQARITGGEAEYHNAQQNPKKAIRFYAKEADTLMNAIMDTNHDLLLDVSTHYVIEDIVVARKYPGMWVLHITGAQL